MSARDFAHPEPERCQVALEAAPLQIVLGLNGTSRPGWPRRTEITPCPAA